MAAKRRTVLSLFTGAGGFDLGLEAAGFKHSLCVESDKDARATLGKNRSWRLSSPGDIHKISPAELLKQARLRPRSLDLLAAGPPCQPFSKSAYWHVGDTRRLKDPRAHTLSAVMDVVEAALPKVLILENVSGLAFSGKSEALRLIRRRLAQINRRHAAGYRLQVLSVNAADFGVPQFRQRLFLVAERSGRLLSLPKRTHGAALPLSPFATAWDAIGDLDRRTWPTALNATGKWARLLSSIPEGHNYLWHTPRNSDKRARPLFGWRTKFWSFLLKLSKAKPSWTVQATPGPATGPFHWRDRRLSVKELCRLQTFPPGYQIIGSYRSAYQQLGNAVPSAIGEMLGLAIRKQFFFDGVPEVLSLIPKPRPRCPSSEPIRRVAKEYDRLVAHHREHPGTGLGPAARRRRTLAA